MRAPTGMWWDWGEADGSRSYSFTQLTINADNDPLMSRMHKLGDEKRSLVIISPEHYGDLPIVALRPISRSLAMTRSALEA